MIIKTSKDAITRGAELLRKGELVAFPTETVYGLGANALDKLAVDKIFEAKNRPANNPLIVHLTDISEFEQIAEIESNRERLEKLKRFWPGPLSVILPARENLPKNVTAGLDTVALRIPDHPVALDLIREAGTPIAAPSANKSEYVSATKAEHVESCLGELVSLIIDAGELGVGVESTVLSLVHDTPTILRPGIVTHAQLKEALKEEVTEEARLKEAPLSPGQHLIHYRPKTPLVLAPDFEPPAENAMIGCIAFDSGPRRAYKFTDRIDLSEKGNLEEVARNLYDALRTLDAYDLDMIVIDSCEPVGIGKAIMNRLDRACSRRKQDATP